MELSWPSKRPQEVFVNGLDWADLLDGADVVSTAAAVLGDSSVVLNVPEASYMEGTVQRVWVSGGAPGRNRVLLTVILSDGRVLQEVVRFNIAG